MVINIYSMSEEELEKHIDETKNMLRKRKREFYDFQDPSEVFFKYAVIPIAGIIVLFGILEISSLLFLGGEYLYKKINHLNLASKERLAATNSLENTLKGGNE